MSPPRHRSKGLLHFYLPLVATSQMMTLSNPLLNLHLSRADDPRVPLAGYSVAFGIGVLLNAPLLTLPNVGAALLSDESAWRRTRAIALGYALTVATLDIVVGLTGLGDWIFGSLLGATARVVDAAQLAMICFCPIPLCLAWRGLRTALSLRSRRTHVLTQSTLLRIVGILAALGLAGMFAEPVAYHAALALSFGIAAETLWLHRQSRGERRALSPTAESLSPRRLAAFALPLVVSGYAWTAQRPVIHAILGRTADSESAQAAFGVLHPLLLLVGSALWALQATGQIHGSNREEARPFLSFSAGAIAVATGLIFVIGWLPAARSLLLEHIFPVAEELGDYLLPGLKLLFLASIFLGIRATAKGLILASGSTKVILAGALSYLGLLLGAGWWVVETQSTINGGVLAVLLIALVEMTEAAVLVTAASSRWAKLPPSISTMSDSAELPSS